MAQNAYLTVKGAVQGAIKGSVTQTGREGSILVHAAGHQVTVNRDAATGGAAGRRMHRPFAITKEVDRATPLLYRAMVSNENLPEWTLRFWRLGPQSIEQQHYTVKLTNALISSIAFRLPDRQDAELARVIEYEEVAFVYQKIEWTWVDGGITAADQWSGPTV